MRRNPVAVVMIIVFVAMFGVMLRVGWEAVDIEYVPAAEWKNTNHGGCHGKALIQAVTEDRRIARH
jgi:hypothetical protein